jgi:hypothetical protein
MAALVDVEGSGGRIELVVSTRGPGRSQAHLPPVSIVLFAVAGVIAAVLWVLSRDWRRTAAEQGVPDVRAQGSTAPHRPGSVSPADSPADSPSKRSRGGDPAGASRGRGSSARRWSWRAIVVAAMTVAPVFVPSVVPPADGAPSAGAILDAWAGDITYDTQDASFSPAPGRTGWC